MKFKIYLIFVILLFCNTLLLAQNTNYATDWVNQYGTDDGGNDGNIIRTDTSGNYYLAGKMRGKGDIGGMLLPKGGNFIAKLDSNMQIIWLKELSNAYEIHDLKVGLSGNIYFSATAIDSIINISVGKRGYLGKLDNNGNYSWLSNFNSYQYGTGIVLDVFENIYYTGYFDTGLFIGSRDSSGTLLWENNYGNIGDKGLSIEINQLGDLFISGKLESIFINFGNSINVTKGGVHSIFILKFNKSTGLAISKSVLNSNSPFSYNLEMKTNHLNELMIYAYNSSTYSINGNSTLHEGGLLKLDSSLNLIWATGADHDTKVGLAIDDVGNIYLGGRFTCTNNNKNCNIPNNSAFLIKYSNNGNVLWIKSSNSPKPNYSYNIEDCTFNSFGHLILVGVNDGDSLDLGNGYQIIDKSFWCKLDTSGNIINTIQYGSQNGGTFYLENIATDTFNNIYVLSKYGDNLTRNQYLKKINSLGNIQWIREINDSLSSFFNISSIEADLIGNIYIAGTFSDTIIFHDGSILTSSSRHSFIAKYDNNGNILWNSVGQGQFTNVRDIGLDDIGGVYIVGSKYITSLFHPNYGSLDIYIERFNRINGINLWMQTFGGTDDDIAEQITPAYYVGISNSIFIVGTFESSSISHSGIGNQVISNQGGQGTTDIFIAQLKTSNGSLSSHPNSFSGIGGNLNEYLVDFVNQKKYYLNSTYYLDNYHLLVRYESPSISFQGGQPLINLPQYYNYSYFVLNNDFYYNTISINNIHSSGRIDNLFEDKNHNIYLFGEGASTIDISGTLYNLSTGHNNKFLYKMNPNSSFNELFYMGRSKRLLSLWEKDYSIFLSNNSLIVASELSFSDHFRNDTDYLADGTVVENIGSQDYYIAKYYQNYSPDTLYCNSTIYENQPNHTFIGNLTTIDQNNLDTFSYSLVSGTGDTGNSSFYISNDSLFTDTTFNYEIQNSYSIRVQTNDGNGGTFETPITINILDANDVPTNLMSIDTIITENQPLGAMVGLLSTTDEDVADNHTYSLVTGTGDTDNGLFAISNDTLKAQTTFDFETQSISYSIRVRTDDGNGGIFERPFTITVQDINDVPDTFLLSNNIIAENQPIGTIVGILSTTDQDVSNIHTYSLVTGTGDTDNSKFSINGTDLETAMILDFEAQSSYSIRLQTNDGNGGILQQVFIITATNNNDIPTLISSTNTAVAENQSIGTIVGTLSTTDQDVSDVHTYSLVSGAGDVDNSKFSINGSDLETAMILDYEAQNSYSIRVKTDDGNGGILEQIFIISAIDSNDTPTLISSTDTSIVENQPIGTVVGSLSTTDQDVSDIHTYSLVTGTGDTDNSKFSINGTDLETAVILDFEVQNSYSIRIKTDDGNGGTLEQIFTILAIDVNDIPTLMSSTDTSIIENQPIGTVVGTFSTTDQDINDVHTYSLVAGTGDTDNSKFSVNGTDLETTVILDYEAQNSYSIRVKTDDGNGGTLEQVFIISAIDANDIPSALEMSDTAIIENVHIGEFVNLLSTTDQDVNDVHTYSLVTGNGDNDNNSFYIVSDSLFSNVEFDFEAQNIYFVRIQTDDGNGGTLQKAFIIDVIDIEPEPVNTINQLTVENLKLFPNPTNNILIIEVDFITSKKSVSLDIIDVLGQRIWKSTTRTNVQSLKHQFDVSEMPTGTYFLRILADEQILTKKIIIQ